MKRTISLLMAFAIVCISAKAQIYDPAPYCGFRNFAFDIGGDPEDVITGVHLNTLNRTIGVLDSGYLYYNTGIATTLGRDSTYPLTIDFVKGDGEYMLMSVFIDYNHNNTFDADEVAYSQNAIAVASFTSGFTLTGNITIPATALTGDTRMRIVFMDSTDTAASVTANPCAMSAGAENPSGDPYPYYGQAVDFNVTIDGNPSGITEINREISGMLYPNPATGTIYLSSGFLGSSVIITDMLGKTVLTCQSVKNNGIDIHALPPGIYIAQISKDGQLSDQRISISK